ncbi:MAG: UDP-N-acetylmuramoyl-L-alanyl-D-glutamate--2,6-diaminopimelate ligase [Ignavibacteria bacterium]|nr:UDP-N-acetylmuramoyl-L-alanyl-D-glutamate--2,6-diaminopimelate ligase [Ignavibacteria bacterium]
MKLSELSKKLSERSLKYKFAFPEDTEITGISYDSRNLNPGNIFFAVKGLQSDGNKFVNEAIAKGAVLVFTKEASDSFEKIPVISVKEIRKFMAVVSGIFYGDPSSKLKLIGITGTNGKTTTSYLIHSMLSEAGYKTGLIGTIEYRIGDKKFESKLTTPDSVELNMILNEMVTENIEYCVMEVSSIALSMDRVYGLKFDTAVFTNLTSEHLDFHKDMGSYLSAKKILFDSLSERSFALSNRDDEYGERITNDTKAEKIFYVIDASIKNSKDIKAENVKLDMNGIKFDLTRLGESTEICCGLAGRFNVYNALASAGTVLNYGVDLNCIKTVLSKFEGVPGRFQKLPMPNGALSVVDYSHTSDSLKNAIEAAREIIDDEGKGGSLITIFGCGGNKDRTKRPVMGKFATELSDYTIITSDNPRFEEPLEIIKEIESGINAGKKYEVIENREEAIKKGIEISSRGDIILICGKGHETYQEVKGVRSHFDDKEIVSKYMNQTSGDAEA